MKQHAKILSGIADIRAHFADDSRPLYFVSATNFNLMGMHDWVAGWRNVSLIDCYDGAQPRTLLVPDEPGRVFESIEDINLYLLQSPQFRQLAGGRGGRAMFLFFDARIEAACRELGIEPVLPPHRLVREIDSKIVTTELGNAAGVGSVPNVLARVEGYASLARLAREHGLGERWVVQTAYGDSGKTTFFIDGEEDYRAAAETIEAEDRVKIMRRVNCLGTAIEACATRWGTFVGPLLTELIGDPALTPYPGGWCGNELRAAALPEPVRRQAQQKTAALGDALYRRGYRGYFEVDYLIDRDSGEVWLGELNSRITGISAMTNLSDFCVREIPLFLFHLLEYDNQIDLRLTPDEFNGAVLASGATGCAGQVILKHTDDALQVITAAPASGTYRLDAGGRLTLLRTGWDRRAALAADEAYILRIMGAGEYAYKGGDLAVMFVNQAIGSAAGRLGDAGMRWVEALKGCFAMRPLEALERSALARAWSPANVKGAPGS